jgi:RNase P subunit RPR2
MLDTAFTGSLHCSPPRIYIVDWFQAAAPLVAAVAAAAAAAATAAATAAASRLVIRQTAVRPCCVPCRTVLWPGQDCALCGQACAVSCVPVSQDARMCGCVM